MKAIGTYEARWDTGAYDTGVSGRTELVPGLDGEDVRRSRMAFDDIRLDHCFQIELLPVFGCFLQRGVQINGVGHEFATASVPSPRIPAKIITGYPVTLSWILAPMA